MEEFKKAQEDANKRRNELITNLEARTKCVGANEFKKGVCGNKGLAHELETGDSEDVEDETEELKKDDSQGQWFLRGKKKEDPDQVNCAHCWILWPVKKKTQKKSTKSGLKKVLPLTRVRS
ncbi:hypothetical protein Peur_000845 [Populus x canadensis]